LLGKGGVNVGSYQRNYHAQNSLWEWGERKNGSVEKLDYWWVKLARGGKDTTH